MYYQKYPDMLQATHTVPKQKPLRRSFLRRLPSYTWRTCIATIGLIVTISIFIIASPLALYDYLKIRKERKGQQGKDSKPHDLKRRTTQRTA